MQPHAHRPSRADAPTPRLAHALQPWFTERVSVKSSAAQRSAAHRCIAETWKMRVSS
jgi:hypothetical protein